MADRYFLACPPSQGRAQLADAEAQHVVRVMRAKVGEVLTLFDGAGQEYLGRIERLERNRVELQIVATAAVDRELKRFIHLGVALPKGDRQRFLVEKAVELGVARLTPLACGRSVVQPGEASVERLGRYVVEASKQCGRNRLMEIAPVADLGTFAKTQEKPGIEPLLLVAHPVAAGGPTSLTASALATLLARESCDVVRLAIGPEGGFSEAEIAAFTAAGWQSVGLGKRILRTETAAIHLVALVAAAGE